MYKSLGIDQILVGGLLIQAGGSATLCPEIQNIVNFI
jgi:hypothetical protein